MIFVSIMQYKAIIFDLDGTLLNTLDDIGSSVNRILTEKGFPTHPLDRYRQFVARRHTLREQMTKQRVEDLGRWLRSLDVLPKSPMGQATKYTLNQWKALTRFLDHGALELDNNIAERALRMIAVGRSNWLFLGSHRGGRTAAILYSLISTCKRHDIDPFEYLRDLFDRISAHPMSQLADFLPNRWKALRDEAALAPVATPQA